MKKIIVVSLLMIFLTGCSVEYKVEIVNDKVNDKLILSDINETILKENGYELIGNLSDGLVIDGIDKDFNKEKDNFVSIGSYNFDEYNNELDRVENAMRAVSVRKEDEYIILEAFGNFNFFEANKSLDKIKLIIRSNHKLAETNADEIDGYNYIWNIDRFNYKDKIPSIKLYSDRYVFDYDGKLKKRIIEIVSIIAIILFVIFVVFSFINGKNKRANRI